MPVIILSVFVFIIAATVAYLAIKWKTSTENARALLQTKQHKSVARYCVWCHINSLKQRN